MAISTSALASRVTLRLGLAIGSPWLRGALLGSTALMAVAIARPAAAQTVFNVSNAADFSAALSAIDSGSAGSYVINVSGTISLSSDLPVINTTSSVAITGSNGAVIDGGGVARGLLVSAGTVSVSNLTISNAVAQGGAGGAGQASGGGGAGLGGGLFVASGATVTLSSVSFLNDSGKGGAGGATNSAFGGGGGGGMGGAGGGSTQGMSAGGGGLGTGATGGTDGPMTGGAVVGGNGSAGTANGAASGGSVTGTNGTTAATATGGANGGGGAGGGNSAGGGGIGGTSVTSANTAGGSGGFGGGGGAALGNAGNGGFGGGGGANGSQATGGGNGGFGGGGGASYTDNAVGAGGFGAGTGGVVTTIGTGPGTGTTASGGGGLGAGGAIFVQEGGTLILAGGVIMGSSVTGGLAGSANTMGTNGSAFGSGIFIQGNNSLTLQAPSGQTLSIADAIADQTGSGGTGANAGAGAIVIKGNGTVSLAGVNTYTGGTTVNSGSTLSIAAANNIGSGLLTLAGGALTTTNTGAITLNSVAMTNAGATIGVANAGGRTTITSALSGSGALTVNGAGTLVLSGANTYTGATTITSGTLALGAGTATGSIASSSGVTLSSGATLALGVTSTGGTTNAAYAIKDLTGVAGSTVAVGSSTLTYGTANSTTFNGSFTGSGVLVKQGSGTVTLDGNSSAYTGTTLVTAGGLVVGDAGNPGAVLGGSVGLNAGTNLSGHGTIGGSLINAGGTVAPGGSIGVLTVNGNYMQTSAGTFAVRLTPNYQAGPGVANDQLFVGGTASQAGTLAVVLDGTGYAIGAAYDILHANGGVSGTFSTVTYNPLLANYVSPTVIYQPNDTYIEILPTLPGGQVPAGPFTDTTFSSAPLFTTGRGFVASSYVTNSALFNTVDTLLNGSSELHVTSPVYTNPQLGTWVEMQGGFGRANDFSITQYGGIVGHGVQVTPNLVVGGAISALGNSTTNPYDRVYGQSVGVFGYGVYTLGRLRLSATGGVGATSLDSHRELLPTSLTGRGHASGFYGAAGVQAEYRITLGKAFVMPFASARYIHTDSGTMGETGADPLNLRYSAVKTDIGAFGGGAKLGFTLPTSFGTLIPWASIGGTGYVGGQNVSTLETVGLISARESANAAPTATLDTGVGVDFIGTSKWRFTAAWTGNYANKSQGNAFELVARYRW